MLYQGSKSEDSWCLCRNTMNDSTFALNVTRNHLQGHEDNSRTAFRPRDASGPGPAANELHAGRGAGALRHKPRPPRRTHHRNVRQNRTGSGSGAATRGWTQDPGSVPVLVKVTLLQWAERVGWIPGTPPPWTPQATPRSSGP